MSRRGSRTNPFRTPRCSECGLELPEAPATYSSSRRLYCESCAPVGDVKADWKPLGTGSVQRMFVIRPNPFARTSR